MGSSEIKMVENKHGTRMTPVCFAFRQGNQRVIGTAAFDELKANLKGTMKYITRFLGADQAQLENYDNTKENVAHDFDVET